MNNKTLKQILDNASSDVEYKVEQYTNQLIMKTKYIKVKASDRLPNKNGCYLSNVGLINFDNVFGWYGMDNYTCKPPEYWLEEVPDYEDEAVELIEKINSIENGVFGLKSFSPELLKEEIKSFLQKVNNKK